MAEEFRIPNLKESAQQVDLLNKEFKKTIDILLKVSQEGQKATSSFRGIGSIKEIQEFETKTKKAITGVSSAYKGLNEIEQAQLKVYKDIQRASLNLVAAKKSETKEYHKLNEAKKLVDKANRDEAKHDAKKIIANKKLASSWAELNIKLSVAEREYRELAVTLGKGNKQTKIAQREVLKLRNQIDGINQPIKRWNSSVGNYASGLRNIAGALGWAGVTFAMVNGIKATYETIKAYDALLKSLDKVTISQQEAAAQFGFVMDISERFGLSLRDTTKDYVRFLAAVKGTTLEGKKARDIFESVSKSAASMGLSAEETSGTLRALNQIISKGKVQAEELRGQLGDRIPGALQIMARSLGVTTSELDEMLKKGEVIADEVLPAFAKEMERTFGVENVNRIDTLVSAQNRLSTAWDKFILSIENGDGVISNFLKKTFNLFSSELNKATSALKGFEGTLETKEIEHYTTFMDKLNEVNSKNVDGLRKLRDGRVEELGLLNKKRAFIKTQIKFGEIDREEGEKKIDQIRVLMAAERGRINAYKDYILNLKEGKKTEDESSLSGGSKSREKISPINQLKTAEELKSEFQDYAKKVMAVLEENFGVEAGKIDPIELPPLDSEEFEAGLTRLQELTNDFITNLSFKSIEDSPLSSLKTFFDGTFEDLILGADTLAEEFAITFNAIGEVAKDTFSLLNELGQDNFEQQLNLLAKEKEVSLLFAGDSVAAKKRIEDQYEERRTQIQRKQAEAQKKQALFNVAINTAEAVVASVAKSPETFGLPFSAFALATGALQTALIASQEIPAFKDGVRGFDGGLAVVGDGGVQEVVRTPDGNTFLTPKTDTLVNLPKGSDVFKNKDEFNADLDNILNSSGIIPFSSQLEQQTPIISVNNTGATASEIDSVMGKYFSNLQVNQTIIDKNGIRTLISKGNSKTVIHNNRVSGKGFSV